MWQKEIRDRVTGTQVEEEEVDMKDRLRVGKQVDEDVKWMRKRNRTKRRDRLW